MGRPVCNPELPHLKSMEISTQQRLVCVPLQPSGLTRRGVDVEPARRIWLHRRSWAALRGRRPSHPVSGWPPWREPYYNMPGSPAIRPHPVSSPSGDRRESRLRNRCTHTAVPVLVNHVRGRSVVRRLSPLGRASGTQRMPDPSDTLARSEPSRRTLRPCRVGRPPRQGQSSGQTLGWDGR